MAIDRRALALAAAGCVFGTAAAGALDEPDAPGCNDSQLLQRMPDCWIDQCSVQEIAIADLQVGLDERARRQVAPDDCRYRSACRNRPQRRDEATIEQDRRSDPPNEVPKVGQGLARLLLALENQLLRARWVRLESLTRESQVDRQHHEALLCAIVEIPFDPVQLARLDVEDGRTALPQRLHFTSEFSALGRTQQPGDDGAVEDHHELGQGGRDRQERSADSVDRRVGPKRQTQAGAARSYPDRRREQRISAIPQVAPTTTNSMIESGRLIAT